MPYVEQRPGSVTWRIRYITADGRWVSRAGFSTKNAALEWARDTENAREGR